MNASARAGFGQRLVASQIHAVLHHHGSCRGCAKFERCSAVKAGHGPDGIGALQRGALEFGAGLEYFLSQSRSMRFEYQVQHFSNAYTANTNPGVDSGLFKLSYTFGR